MRLLLFTVFIISNLLYIKGQKKPASSPAKTYKDFNIDELYNQNIAKDKLIRSGCQTEECKLDALIKKFGEESQTAPPTEQPRPKSMFGNILAYLKNKLNVITQIPRSLAGLD